MDKDEKLKDSREEVIDSRMKEFEKNYVESQDFRIFIGTWNVNGQSSTVSLGESWLSCDPAPPDIYAIGFQELDLSKEAFLFSDTPKEAEWLNAVTLSLDPREHYVKVKLIRLVGMMLIVFVKRELSEHVSNVSASTVGTGILGKMGNKGGVAIRLNLYCTSICFVNSHLAAHQDECERRNQDFNEICNRMEFSFNGQIAYIKDHDHIYWFGDLNYRINDLTSNEVKLHIERKEFQTLFEHDQLREQQKLKKVFQNFNEAPIRYQPTYKYDPGTDLWDSSEKNRSPAWCDRILWSGQGRTKCIVYRSHPQLRLSDHKPVSALFSTDIKIINPEKYRKTYEDVIKQLDRSENDNLPQVAVDRMEIDFGKVHFQESVIRSLTIVNTGLTSVRFRFIEKPGETSYCKPFLQIKPPYGRIEIGKRSEVQLEIFVNEQTAGELNRRNEHIDEILVLHLEHGKDIFITLNGSYVPSSFGSSIETLIRIEKSVVEYGEDNFVRLLNNYAQFKRQRLVKSVSCIDKPLIMLDEKPELLNNYGESNGEHATADEVRQCWTIPKEIWLLVNHLFTYGMDQSELFTQPGLKSEFANIRTAIDTCDHNPINASVHSVAEALLVFLECLTEPVIPYEFYKQAIESIKNFALCRQVINEIPECHRRVFYYLISFMKELIKHSRHNRLEPSLLANIFGRVLLRPPKDVLQQTKRSQFPILDIGSVSGIQVGPRNQGNFVYHFLANDYDV